MPTIKNRVNGLDSLRFICAAIVMIGHFGIRLPSPFDEHAEGGWKIVRGIINCLFNGPAAVIVFFIISGFCINYPFRNADSIPLLPFYARRLTRIGIPAVAAIGIYILFGFKLAPPDFLVFWSIICEIVYYLLFPLLRQWRIRYGWISLISIAFAASYALAICSPDLLAKSHNSYVALANWTWVVGLPCWLLGCWLSEHVARFRSLTHHQIWALRTLVLFISVALQVARFHVHSIWTSYCITLNTFSIIACIWIGCEVAYFSERPTSQLLERCGKWSYSLYLLHDLIPGVIPRIDLGNFIPYEITWILIAIVMSYFFYLIVELPSHRLAASLGKRLDPAGDCAVAKRILLLPQPSGHIKS